MHPVDGGHVCTTGVRLSRAAQQQINHGHKACNGRFDRRTLREPDPVEPHPSRARGSAHRGTCRRRSAWRSAWRASSSARVPPISNRMEWKDEGSREGRREPGSLEISTRHTSTPAKSERDRPSKLRGLRDLARRRRGAIGCATWRRDPRRSTGPRIARRSRHSRPRARAPAPGRAGTSPEVQRGRPPRSKRGGSSRHRILPPALRRRPHLAFAAPDR